MNKRLMVFVLAVFAAFIAGCTGDDTLNQQDVDSDALARLIREYPADFYLVDVRTPEEYAAGHIPTAINIPLDTIAATFPVEKKDARIIVYCRSGNRSGQAQKILFEQGYGDVYNFGGISRWTGVQVKGDLPGELE